MYLSIGPDQVVSVHEADDFTRLHLELHEIGPDAAGQALQAAGLGRLHGLDHAYLDLAALRGLASASATTPGWAAGWDAMVEYARRKEWLSADGHAVRVHLA
ncbi:hypothetical protein ABZ907_43680 [Nonomuraea wenchangensis]